MLGIKCCFTATKYYLLSTIYQKRFNRKDAKKAQRNAKSCVVEIVVGSQARCFFYHEVHGGSRSTRSEWDAWIYRYADDLKSYAKTEVIIIDTEVVVAHAGFYLTK